MMISEQLLMALGERRGFRRFRRGGFPVGTKRRRKDGDYIKTRRGWVRIPKGSKKKSPEAEKISSAVSGLKKAVEAGKLKKGMSLGQHIKKSKQVQKKHAQNFDKLMSKMKELAPGAEVQGRVKKLESVMGKMLRKPDKYKEAGDLQDVTGTRVIHDTPDQVLATVGRIKDEFEVVDEDDYITKPKSDGYMSYHMIIKDKDGLEKEVQVRTKNQNRMGDWAHDIYKPQTPEQEKAVQEARDVLEDYATKLWKWYEKKDRGEDPGPEPDCPEIAKKSFGCGPEG
jgi:ppGpp synthetase/RelA/SpoT-type nucleotidyltranferase